MLSLNRFLKIQRLLVGVKRLIAVKLWGMDIHPTVVMSLSVRLDRTYPKGVHIAEYTYLAFEVAILAHDMTRGIYRHTRIGKNCFIGARSIILPGVEIGDGCVIGSGSVVTKSVPPGSVAVGNPARIIRENVSVGRYGRFPDAEENKRRDLEMSGR